MCTMLQDCSLYGTRLKGPQKREEKVKSIGRIGLKFRVFELKRTILKWHASCCWLAGKILRD